MHYGAESFSRTGQWTMKAKSKVNKGFFSHKIRRRDSLINSLFTQGCDLRWVGAAFDGRGASPNDWLLLSRVADKMCNNKTKANKKIFGKI